MNKDEFALWQAITESSRFQWVEDSIFRLNERGAFYYIGGEDGSYMRIHKDGRLEIGTYEGAIPHIGEAGFMPKSERQYADYNTAFTTAIQLGGKKFFLDMFGGTLPVLPKSAKDNDDISDPMVSMADMHAYGYAYEGMIPLGKERALELHDAGYEIFRLYGDDSEGLAESRAEIQAHDGLFGIDVGAERGAMHHCHSFGKSEHGADEKPSVLAQIKTTHQPPSAPREKPPHHKSKGGPER